MKKLLILFLILIFGCENLEVKKEFYDSGTVRREIHSKNDLPYIIKRYNENGELSNYTEYEYDETGIQISEKQYNSEGQIVNHFYTKGQEGNPDEYYYMNYEYYPSGELKVKSKEDGYDGVYSKEEYYLSGQLKSSYNYNGLCESFYENGNLEMKYNTKNGEMIGKAERYDEDGQPLRLNKIGKPLLKYGELRGALIQSSFYDITGLLGNPDKTFITPALTKAYVYFNSALDVQGERIIHLCFLMNPDYRVERVYWCYPGERLSIGTSDISTPN